MPKRLNKISCRNVISVIVALTLVDLFQTDPVSGIECGTVNMIHDVVRGGNEAVKGAWPFVVVIYRVNYTRPYCEGTLISNKHVLTGNN